MNYTYLLINLTLLMVSAVLFSFRRINVLADSKFLILAAFINVFVFSVPTEYLTRVKVIVFNPPFLIGINLWGLPVEELFFSLSMPLCGLAIYLFLNASFPDQRLEKYSLAFSNILMGVCVAILYFGYHHLYTLITFSLLLVFILYVEYVNKIRFMYKFYRAFLVSLIPFYISSGILNGLPVIQYSEEDTLIFNLFKVPFESTFYFMGMLLLVVYLFEAFKNKSGR